MPKYRDWDLYEDEEPHRHSRRPRPKNDPEDDRWDLQDSLRHRNKKNPERTRVNKGVDKTKK